MKKNFSSVISKTLPAIFFIGLSFQLPAQLNSVDAYVGTHKILNPFYADPAQKMGWTYGIRYNMDFSWEWALMLSAGMDNTTFNLRSKDAASSEITTIQTKNSYADFTLGLEWQWLTDLRTRAGGGKVSCKGSKAIIMANFKSYVIGAINYKMLMKKTSDLSAKSVLSWNAGLGFEWVRLGPNAHHGNNAFVPFTEFIYGSNLKSGMATDADKQNIVFKMFLIRFGVKYTFGFPERKFAWK